MRRPVLLRSTPLGPRVWPRMTRSSRCPESVTRLLFEKSGLPEVQIQLPVQTDVGGLLTIDGSSSALWVGFVKGDPPSDRPRAVALNLARFEALARAGWKITRVTASRSVAPEPASISSRRKPQRQLLARVGGREMEKSDDAILSGLYHLGGGLSFSFTKSASRLP